MLNTHESRPPKLHRIGCYEEEAGILHELKENDEILVAHIGKLNLGLPLDMEESLRLMIGQAITILRTDIPNNTYIFRVLSEESGKIEE